MTTISNGEITAVVSPKGAELQSVIDTHTHREYMWQGDPRWWGRRSPLLFPIVGGMWNSVCRIDGQEIQIPKHGFMQDRIWQTVDEQPESVRLEYVGTVGDFAIFPFAFKLAITYRLEGRKVVADFEVKNTGGCDLWFQFGGHPAIALPDWDEKNEIDGFLRLEGEPQYLLRAREQGCTESEHYPVPTDELGLIPLCVATFANEALIFDNHQVKAATVLDRNRCPVARVASSSPAWLFWSPTGIHTPFVCCEPWYGLPDPEHFEGPIANRPFINCTHAGQTWTGFYSIEVF